MLSRLHPSLAGSLLGASIKTLLVCGAIPLCACATLPETPQLAESAITSPPVNFETARGPVSARKNAAIFAEIKRDGGETEILRRHLAVEEAINRGSPLVLGNRLTLLQDGPATYKAMFAAIRGARDHVNLQTYIFEAGPTGDAFARLLLEKQASGVQVNIIYDSVGSITTPPQFFERLRRAGIRTLEFNPVNPAKLKKKAWRLNNRDHRKLLIVDGKTAFLGGINISETYSSGSLSRPSKKSADGEPEGWRDTHLQVDGPVVAEYQKLFFDTWTRQKGAPVAPRNYFPKLTRQGDEIVRAVASEADDSDSAIYLTLLSAIEHAERTIRLTNAYFVPDPQLRRALVDAARRGVDVQIILPSRTDSWAVFHAGRSHYDELLEAGVRIYERRGTVLHAKTATVDGVWSTIGSTNLDWRSFLHNDELNAVVLGTDFARQVNAMFARDRAASDLIELGQWRRRSLFIRLEEWLAGRFEYWL